MSNTNSSNSVFGGDSAAIYAKIAHQHRHPDGPWHLMTATIVDLASGPGEPAMTIANAMPSATVFSTDVSLDMHKISAAKAV